MASEVANNQQEVLNATNAAAAAAEATATAAETIVTDAAAAAGAAAESVAAAVEGAADAVVAAAVDEAAAVKADVAAVVAAPKAPKVVVHKADFEKDIIYLYQFSRVPTLPSMSPYCLKVETWLRLAQLKYEVSVRRCVWVDHPICFNIAFTLGGVLHSPHICVRKIDKPHASFGVPFFERFAALSFRACAKNILCAVHVLIRRHSHSHSNYLRTFYAVFGVLSHFRYHTAAQRSIFHDHSCRTEMMVSLERYLYALRSVLSYA